MEVPTCKRCLYAGSYCIRCNKTELNQYKVTENGVVCNSCSKYFRELKKCAWCNKISTSVSNRKLDSGIELICGNCYTKTLPLCSRCKYRRKPLIYDFNKQPICKICALEKRHCTHCQIEISAGRGHICFSCSYLKTLEKRMKFGSNALSHYLSETYILFSDWLKNERGIQFAATHLNRYFPYFISLDKLSVSLNRLPTYTEVVDKLTVAETRRNLLATFFLDQRGLIIVDKDTKDMYSNIDTIHRYLNRFNNGTFFKEAIQRYYDFLHEKLNKNKTTLRSIRLALTPAIELCTWSIHFELEKPNNEVLHGFLWAKPGQKSAITGFINFLNLKYQLTLILPDVDSPEFSRPHESRLHLKQQFIKLLRTPESTNLYKENLIKIALSYLHGISIPKYVWISPASIRQNKQGEGYIRLLNQKIYFPEYLITIIF